MVHTLRKMKCRLCQKESELMRSHILPDFFRDDSASKFPTGSSQKLQPFTQPIHTTPGLRFKRQQHGYWEKKHGLIERLLCHECEQKFSALEDYAKRFFYGGTSPIRIQLSAPEEPVFRADYKRMKLFQMSLLWRAGEAKGEFFAAVQLDEQDRERLRELLLNDNPGDENEFFCAMSRLCVSPMVRLLLTAHNCSVETGVYAPVAHQHQGWQTFTFLMGGIGWVFCVSSIGVPQIMRNTYIKRDGQFYFLPMNGDAFLYQFSTKAVRAGNVTREDVEESIQAKKGKP